MSGYILFLRITSRIIEKGIVRVIATVAISDDVRKHPLKWAIKRD